MKGSLFEAPKGSWLCHATNCMGGWGPVIAAQFAQRYPDAYARYKEHCLSYSPDELVGSSLVIEHPEGKEPTVVCLFTSQGYSRMKDSPEDIVQATQAALQHLKDTHATLPTIHAPKLNAGMFAVPWEQTEAVLEASGLSWTIYTP